MYKRLQRTGKASANHSNAPANQFAPRRFVIQPQIEEQNQTPDLQAQSSTTKTSKLPNISIVPPNYQPPPSPRVQMKLTIGEPGDKFEQEADKLAADITQKINTPENNPVQRLEQPEDEDKLQAKPIVQRLSVAGGTVATPDLETSIQRARGSGQPLAESIREPMETAFGADFSGVKVHTDAQSDQLNQSIQAKAFTTGQDIFFRQGSYDPGSRGGQELLAHELTHVVQQQPILRMKTEKNITINRGDEQENYAVEWETAGKLNQVTVNGEKPLDAFVLQKDLFNNVRGIADIRLDPTNFRIMVYPTNPKFGIWSITTPTVRDKFFSWKLLSSTEETGSLWWKETVAKSRAMLVGIDNMNDAQAIAGKIYDNMREHVSYKLGTGTGVDAVVAGATGAECDAINGALGIIIQAALASKGVEAEVKKTAVQTSFLTQDVDRSNQSVIKGHKSNIYTEAGENYTGHRIKFDNHGWITVEGKVYDLVAGIRGGAASCVDLELTTVVEEQEYTANGGAIVLKKITPTQAKDPWQAGYDMTNAE